MPRATYDHPKAAIVEMLCPKCCHATGAKNPEVFYYDLQGNELMPEWEG
jgi:hypothetical protein